MFGLPTKIGQNMDIRFRVRAAVIVVLLFGVAACSGQQPKQPDHPAAASGEPSSSAGTRMVEYRPWRGAELASGVRMSTSTDGSCWTMSIASRRPDAYRCMDNDSSIYDPCFVGRGANQAACPFPSPSSVTVIHYDPPLPAPDPDAEGDRGPWLVVLVDGQQCYALTGTTETINGLVTSYACERGTLYGDPVRNAPQWTIYYQEEGSQRLTSMTIETAYR
jgi:hypothetical protein